MAELTQQERLQPSLLDRLTDDDRHEAVESRDARVINAAKLREYVIRDISWLLNCVRHWPDEQDIADAPHAFDSVLNYGIPDLAGALLSGLDVKLIENRIRAAIVAFEPRLSAANLQVVARVDDSRMDRRALSFTIESDMWAQPMPVELYLRTEVDLENGRFSLLEGAR
ncbi:type VI secretion system baseplate subunit TssE [Luteimonas abyssi]|uniref:type VI secretion system baseplate subunit TssE n=1 Tax=Luteimonas abyssi TaxID=1247514 RepID=UPI000737CA8E|nr:type VI secretion system baseplate subunit TssE [Luteimonas abyssi]